jgi:hypothetical protein
MVEILRLLPLGALAMRGFAPVPVRREIPHPRDGGRDEQVEVERGEAHVLVPSMTPSRV